MGNQANQMQISMFLTQIKQLLAAGRVDFVPRRKNLQSLARYGLTILDAKYMLSKLDISDYKKGPKADFDPSRPGEIWEFKKNMNGISFYIKLKIAMENDESILRCLGFHEDDFA